MGPSVPDGRNGAEALTHSPAPESVVDGRVEGADDEQREEEVEGAGAQFNAD